MLTISIEIELAWGVHDLDDRAHLSADGQQERAHLRTLLDVADEHGIPISFNIVGHLLLNSCDGDHDGPYDRRWFDADPGTNVETDPLFYAPDMARAVLESSVDHELCTHTFSHVLCNDVSDAVLDEELQRIQELHAMIDEPVRSFVPPRHHRPNIEVLRENGIQTVRCAKSTDSATPIHRLKELLFGPLPEWDPCERNGVLETYCTRYSSLTAATLPRGQEPPPYPCKWVPVSVRKHAHLKYLKRTTNQAMQRDTAIHHWCHLFNLSNDHQMAVLKRYFEYLGEMREVGLEIKTMAGLRDAISNGGS